MSDTAALSWLVMGESCSFAERSGCDCTIRLRASPPAQQIIDAINEFYVFFIQVTFFYVFNVFFNFSHVYLKKGQMQSINM